MGKPSQPKSIDPSVESIENAPLVMAKAMPWGEPLLRRPDRVNVFPAKRGNGKSCIAITAIVPTVIGLVLEMAVWARYRELEDGAEITYEAALPQRISTVDDDTRTSLLNHVNTHVEAWSGFDQAKDHAVAALTGKPVAKQVGLTATRLVRRPVADNPPASQQ